MYKQELAKTSQSRGYPLEDIQYEMLATEKKQVVKKLCYLFSFYAGKASKHAYHELPEHYYMEIVGDVWLQKGEALTKNKGNWKELQILYHGKGIKNSLSFKNFLDILPTLAIHAESDLPTEQAMKGLMHYLMTVYENKVLPEIDGKVVNVNLIIEEDTKLFVSKLSGSLTRLYKVYFPHQIITKGKPKNLRTKSIESLTQFLKDFEVYPKLISARDIFYIFNQACESGLSQLLLETEESKRTISQLGETFKLSKFIQCLLIISKNSFTKLKQVQNEQQWQKQQKYMLRTLLEYMETVKTTNKKNTRYSNERFCFIVLEEHQDEFEKMKTIQVKDKIIRESVSNMDFFTLIDRLSL